MAIHPDYAPLLDDIRNHSPDNYDDAVFQHPMDFYRKRVAMIGAKGYDLVLDAGHGFGQWSVVLAENNQRVIGIDHNQPRYECSKIIKEHFRAENFEPHLDSLYDAEKYVEPGMVDLIWCWSVVMFVDRSKLLPIFANLLRKDGILILGAVNTPSRWAYKIYKGAKDGVRNRNFYKSCLKGMFGLNRDVGSNAYNFAAAGKIGEQYGFKLDATGRDGCIARHAEPCLPFEADVPERFQNIELVYIKK